MALKKRNFAGTQKQIMSYFKGEVSIDNLHKQHRHYRMKILMMTCLIFIKIG